MMKTCSGTVGLPRTVADPGERPRGPASLPLFLDQTEARRAEKKLF